jgi:mannose-6-phosphate isomerase-like protein (cupin superfamily)
MGKLDELFYTIPKDYHNWDGYASPRCGFPGNMVMPHTHMNMGFSVATKAEYMEVPHIHDAIEEYLVFTGADLVDFFGSFDAEVEVWLGEDPLKMEKITITSPTIIRVPPHVWHCPINFKRVGKPVCFIPLYLDGSWGKITKSFDKNGREVFNYEGEGLRHCVKDMTKLCVYCGKCFSEAAKELEAGGAPDDFLAPYYEMEKVNGRTGAFDKYVYTMEPEYHQWGDWLASPRGGYSGIEIDKDAKLYYGYDIILKPTPMDDAHIHHAVEEYLMFTGADLMDPFGSFDAEITIMIGDDPDEMEEHIITAPTVIRIPPNVWHCPINFKRVGKPVNFMPIYPDGCWSKISRQYIKPNGSPTYVYEGVGLAKCRLDSSKKCTFCGKCTSMKPAEQK